MEVPDLVIEDLVKEFRLLREEVYKLKDAVRRPDRISYRPNELAKRLKCSPAHVYNLWNRGDLRFKKDHRGRFSTEAHVEEYLTKFEKR